MPASPSGPILSAAQGQVEITFTFNHRSGIASNQYAVWIENGDGQLIKTLFVTHFTASGGWKTRPDAISVWVGKSGVSSGSSQNVDTVTGATPVTGRQTYVWDCTDENGQPVPAGDYHFFVEGTIYWKDAVLYDGIIHIGSEANTAQATAQYTTETAKGSDMITGVEAAYKP